MNKNKQLKESMKVRGRKKAQPWTPFSSVKKAAKKIQKKHNLKP